ncbi:Zinc finger protein 92 [Amphibalanus amphitrite]|uniref:Zinc finger protein 92 n=1 Tax=Amphibalanus amphitrite TaxID=1232801 RepID=A0A6A4X0E7_AMPAM|nr:Zinc finger protein 92 [Amphibalanus amphitrite]
MYRFWIPCPEPGCGAVLRSSQRLSDHRAWHRGDTTCPVCTKCFSRPDVLREHRRRSSACRPAPACSCDSCLALISRGFKPLHTGQKPGLPCRVPGCGAVLKNRARLSDHNAWHRGDTVCPVCTKRFSTPGNLREHCRTVRCAPPPPPPPPQARAAQFKW